MFTYLRFLCKLCHWSQEIFLKITTVISPFLSFYFTWLISKSNLSLIGGTRHWNVEGRVGYTQLLTSYNHTSSLVVLLWRCYPCVANMCIRLWVVSIFMSDLRGKRNLKIRHYYGMYSMHGHTFRPQTYLTSPIFFTWGWAHPQNLVF